MIKSFRNICFILLLNYTCQVQAMGFLDVFKIVVFSEVSGVVTLDGSPVEGAEVVRVADHEEDKVYTDRTITDNNGKFYFKEISVFSMRPLMLGTIIRQKIIIKYKEMEYLAWKTIKHNNHNYGELNDKGVENPVKLNLLCELTGDQEKFEIIQFATGKERITGLCRWG